MTRTRFLPVLMCVVLLVGAVAFTSKAAHAAGFAYIRAFYGANQNAHPEREQAKLSLDGTLVFSNVRLGTFTPYLKVPAGMHHVEPATDGYPVPEDVTFAANQRYTIYITEGFIYCGGSEETCMQVFAAPNRPSSGRATLRLMPSLISPEQVRLVNEITGQTLLQVDDVPRSTQVAVSNLVFPCVRYAQRVTPDGEDVIAMHCFPDMRLQSRERYTIWFVQPPDGAAVPIIQND